MGEPSSFIDEIGHPDPTWTVVETTSTDHHYLPAIPEPTTTPVPVLLDACTAVVEWAEQCDDAAEVQEVYERMVAIATYLSRQDHALAAESALRRLEERIGELSPALSPGDRRSDDFRSRTRDLKLPKQRVEEFRQMATHPEVVKQVIAESTNASPPSRRKVLEAIKNLEQVAKGEAQEARAAHKQEFREMQEWAESITPDDYDPAEDEHSSSVRKAILSAARGMEQLATFSAEDVRRALNHSNPKVRDIILPTYLNDLRTIIETVDRFRELLP